MRIVDAFWEKRNLGVDCLEVLIEDNDNAADIKKRLAPLQASYMVVKVPSGRFDIMSVVQGLGYSFIEGGMNVVNTNLNNVPLSPIMKRLNASISHQEMDGYDIQIMQSEIRKGIFKTDRIYLDPFFSNELAAERYIYWIQDELNRGSQVYKLIYKGESIGFFTFKETEPGVCYPFLISLYKKFEDSGLGQIAVYKAIEEANNRGMRKISTNISSNNNAVIKIHSSLGYIIDNISYVYIKHNVGGN